MNTIGNREQLNQWLRQLEAGRPDEELTKKIVNWLSASGPQQLQRFTAALQAADEDTELTTLLQACLSDEIRVADNYPQFDLPFLLSPELRSSKAIEPDAPLEKIIQAALAQGLKILRDMEGGVHIVLQAIIQPRQVAPSLAGSAVRGRGEPLFRYTLEEETGRAIDVTVTADDKEYCSIEVFLLQHEKHPAEMSGIAVTLRYEAVEETKMTNHGRVEFTNIPRSKLEQIVVRVTPTP